MCTLRALPSWAASTAVRRATNQHQATAHALVCADVSNDVRRAAVLNLGFVLASTPEQCPRIVSLLAESYNPHVR